MANVQVLDVQHLGQTEAILSCCYNLELSLFCEKPFDIILRPDVSVDSLLMVTFNFVDENIQYCAKVLGTCKKKFRKEKML